jgi:hypothetical protein
VHFPAGEHEEPVVVWLWSERQGVFSHQTALGLHGLSEGESALDRALPARRTPRASKLDIFEEKISRRRPPNRRSG